MPSTPTHSVLRPAGGVIITSPEGVTEYDTLRCIHCQRQWQVVPGSGRQRGFCTKCCGPLCGKQECMETCEHWEKKAERLEKEARLILP